MPIEAPDWMVIDSIRYAMGRRTYQVGTTCAWIRAHWWSLPTEVANQIKRDIEEEFARVERTQNPDLMGDACDRREWEQVRALWLNQK